MGKFELFALTETNLKGNGEVSWSGMIGTIAGVQEIESAMEGEAVLTNDERDGAVIGFGCISFRIQEVKFKFSRVKVCVVAV